MIARIAVLLALAGATLGVAPALAAQAEADTAHGSAHAAPAAAHANPVAEAQAQAVEAAGHGTDDAHASDKVDFIGAVLDARYIRIPFVGYVDLPPAHSWQVGPLDLTPTKHLIFLTLAALLTLGTLLMGGALAGRAKDGRTSGRRHNAIEAMVLFIRNEVVKPNIGKGSDAFAPFVITLFFFILFANLVGLLPYAYSATANISVTAALALLVFITTEVAGMVKLGPAGYFKTVFFMPAGMNPVAGGLLGLALMPVEIIGKITKPISLALRLMANMVAGKIVFLAILSLIFVFGSWAITPAPLFLAVAIFFLEIFVSFLQAFIFAMLTSVFIGLIVHSHH